VAQPMRDQLVRRCGRRHLLETMRRRDAFLRELNEARMQAVS
jgi:hypothetical protein